MNDTTNLDRREPSTANILETIRLRLPELRKSNRKVAEIVLADPRRITSATVAEVAAMASVSQPTIIRFAVEIGCEGFLDFKLRLAESLALGTPATHSVISDTDETGSVIGKVFDYTMTSLHWARNHLDEKAVTDAVDLLSKARTIHFFGYGASGIVAADAQQKFPLFGVPCSYESDAHQQYIAATMMRPGDVVVAISHTGSTRLVIDVARTARDHGAKVIAIIGDESRLQAQADVSLIVRTLDNTNVFTPTTSRIAALVIIDILSTCVALTKDDTEHQRYYAMKRQLQSMRSDS